MKWARRRPWPTVFLSLLLIIGLLGLGGCSWPGGYTDSRQGALVHRAAPKKIALMLPMRGRWRKAAYQISKGVQQRFYAWSTVASERDKLALAAASELTFPQAPPLEECDCQLRLLDSSTEPVGELYQRTVAEGSEILIGPLTKNEIADLAAHAAPLKIPVLALNSAPLEDYQPVAGLYYFGPSPVDELAQLLERLAREGRARCAVIVEDRKSAQRLWQLLSWQQRARYPAIRLEVLQLNKQQNLSRQLCRFFSADASGSLCNAQMRKKMQARAAAADEEASDQSLVRQDLDGVLLLAEPELTVQLVPLLRFYFLEHLPILSLSSGFDRQLNLADLEGLQFLEMPYVAEALIRQLNSWALTKRVSGGAGGLAATAAAASPAASSKAGYASRSAAGRLYALGLDACWLARNFYQLVRSAPRPWLGASGQLQLTRDNRIMRRLNWVKVHQGQLRVMDY